MTERRLFFLASTVNSVEAAHLLDVSRRTIENYCQAGLFRTARKCGIGRTSPWMIDRDEVLAQSKAKPQLETHAKIRNSSNVGRSNAGIRARATG